MDTTIIDPSAITKKEVMVYTDGACRGNPGPGGWGVLLRYQKHHHKKIYEKRINGAVFDTTNNRMELTAVINALQQLKEPCIINITTDSTYVKLGITKHLKQWKQRGWLTCNKRPVKNIDLWLQLEELVSRHQIIWHWVKGHSGHSENEIVDQLANQALDELLGKDKQSK